MSKPEFSRPFNLEHAKAGAPFSGERGEAVQVIKWDRKHPTHPIIAIEVDGDQEAAAFRIDGTTDHGHPAVVQRLVMLPLGFIDGKPIFVGDELVCISSGRITFVEPDDKNFSHCRWPAPTPTYPETQIGEDDLHLAFVSCGPENATDLKAVANAALRHAIDAGQVVPADASAESVRKAYADGQAIAYKHEAGGRAARDLAVAVAVNNAVAEIALARNFVFGLDLPSIIASVTGTKDAQPIDFSIEKGDMVYRKTWGGGKEPVEVVNINWALKAIAVKLSPTGATVVWPVAGMTKDRFSEDAKEGAQ